MQLDKKKLWHQHALETSFQHGSKCGSWWRWGPKLWYHIVSKRCHLELTAYLQGKSTYPQIFGDQSTYFSVKSLVFSSKSHLLPLQKLCIFAAPKKKWKCQWNHLGAKVKSPRGKGVSPVIGFKKRNKSSPETHLAHGISGFSHDSRPNHPSDGHLLALLLVFGACGGF